MYIVQDQQERKICSFLKRFQEIYKVKLYDKERKSILLRG